jgi:deoxyribose-phosphate aldolase
LLSNTAELLANINSSEAALALSAGATELDIVINYPRLKTCDYETIYNELATLRSLAPRPVVLKLILETSQLTEAEIVAGCVLAASANFDFVKTSTGFNGRGASLDDVYLMRAAAKELAHREIGQRVNGKVVEMSVKASGGVRSLKDAMKMIEAGANRIGTSSGIWIMQEAREVVKNDQWARPDTSRLWPDEDY